MEAPRVSIIRTTGRPIPYLLRVATVQVINGDVSNRGMGGGFREALFRGLTRTYSGPARLRLDFPAFPRTCSPNPSLC